MTIASRLVIVCIFAFIFGVTMVDAQSFGRSELIKASSMLESDPLGDNAKAIRGLAVRYVIETSDVSVVVCGGEIMAPLLDKKNKNSTELIGQYTIGMAAFKLQNPENKDENAAQQAGIESALKAYESILQKKPKTKHAGMDDLVAKRNSGELAELVAKANCGKK